MKFGVGTVRAFNLQTGCAELIAHNGQLATISPAVCERSGLAPEDVGRRASFVARDGFHVIPIERLQLRPRSAGAAPFWPDFGELVRLVCTVMRFDPATPRRFIWHPEIPHDILVRPKHSNRRDLRYGDKVVAEVMRWNKGLMAIRTVRLPKDYLSKSAAHAHLLTEVPLMEGAGSSARNAH